MLYRSHAVIAADLVCYAANGLRWNAVKYLLGRSAEGVAEFNHKMNNLYFACRTCHNFIDAGYRHCYWTLAAPGIVARNKLVDVSAVLEATGYWQDADGVDNGLLEVKPFLHQHQDHDLIFGEYDDFVIFPRYGGDDGVDGVFEWMDEGNDCPELSPRYFFERLKMRTWAQVREYMETQTSPPWWWDESECMPRAKAKFLLLTQNLTDDGPAIGAA